MSTCQPYKLQCANTVYMATCVTMLQVYKTTKYLLVKRCLCIALQASRFLSPSVTIKLLSNAKYMVTLISRSVIPVVYIKTTVDQRSGKWQSKNTTIFVGTIIYQLHVSAVIGHLQVGIQRQRKNIYYEYRCEGTRSRLQIYGVLWSNLCWSKHVTPGHQCFKTQPREPN